MAKKVVKTEYFTNVETLNDVRATLVNNMDKIEDAEFLAKFEKFYNKYRSVREGKYGRYNGKCLVTAKQYIKAVRAVRDLTKIRLVGEDKTVPIKLTVRFHMGGINLKGDTKIIREVLLALKYKWNPKTEEWYNGYSVMTPIVAIPETITVKTQKAKKAKVTVPGPKATQPPVKKTGKPKLAEPRKLTGKEAEKAMAEFKARKQVKKERRERIQKTTRRA